MTRIGSELLRHFTLSIRPIGNCKRWWLLPILLKIFNVEKTDSSTNLFVMLWVERYRQCGKLFPQIQIDVSKHVSYTSTAQTKIITRDTGWHLSRIDQMTAKIDIKEAIRFSDYWNDFLKRDHPFLRRGMTTIDIWAYSWTFSSTTNLLLPCQIEMTTTKLEPMIWDLLELFRSIRYKFSNKRCAYLFYFMEHTRIEGSLIHNGEHVLTEEFLRIKVRLLTTLWCVDSFSP